MKNLFLFSLFLFSIVSYAQINLSGEAKYKLSIIGYYGRDSDGCGSIDGLREINTTYADGTVSSTFNGRKLYDNVDFEIDYTKNNKIVNIQTKIIIRYKNALGNCDGGSGDRIKDYPIPSTCYGFYAADAGDELHRLSIISLPYVKINHDNSPLYLGDTDYLTITLPDNLDSEHYRWKYKVGNGEEHYFSDSYNNTPVLHIRGDQFLSSSDLGKTISVWIEMGCDAGDKLASGIANRDAYLVLLDKAQTCSNTYFSCTYKCGYFNSQCTAECSKQHNSCVQSTYNETISYYENLYNSIKDQYQSQNSNAIQFTYMKTAPHITGANTKSATCYDTNNGEVKFSFERNLTQNETISLILTKKSPINNTYEFYTSKENLITLSEENTTFKNLEPGDYRLELLGKYDGNNTYSDDLNYHKIDFTIKKPVPVSFDLSQITPIRCFGGQDGIIKLTAQGGQGNYLYQVQNPDGQTSAWIPFPSGNTAELTGLKPGIYKIQVKDSNGCIAKEIVKNGSGTIIGLGAEITKTVTLTQPEKAVNIEYVDSKNPIASGMANGYIKAHITGGTPYSGTNLYNYIWKYEDGTVYTDITPEIISGNEGWFLTLKNAKSGKYTLTITDANYSSASDKSGCTVAESEFTLMQPDPLQATLKISKEISCNSKNEYGNETDVNPMDGQRDESQDGALLVAVTGGVKPYTYIWKKEINGVWTVISSQTNQADTSLAYNLSEGNYSFNVKDANGIIMGDYVNNQLVTEKNKIFYLQQPTQLKVSLQSTEVSCNPGNNGTIKATATGGVAPYTYTWTNGATTQQINNLIPGVYKVIVNDARGCQVEGNVILQQPGELDLQPTIVNPTCYGGSNGSASVAVSGGKAPYKYEWSTGATTSSITNLSKGVYTLKITDASGCIAIRNIEVKDPEKIILNLGYDRVLCNGQSLSLNVSLTDTKATYQWSSTNGFTSSSPKVTLTEAGTYTIKVTTSQGCSVMDKITVTRSFTDINSEFLLASQAYVNEEVILVNVSNPLGKTTIWNIPNTVQILSKDDREISLQFPQKGTYLIGLTSTQGDCYEYYEKAIIVEDSWNIPNPGTTENPFIQEFTLAPNPNNGNFQIKVKLSEESPISLRIFNISGAMISDEKKLSGNSSYEVNYQLSNLGSATYVIVLETAKGTKVKRMITY